MEGASVRKRAQNCGKKDERTYLLRRVSGEPMPVHAS
jgi:hypothetical protein